MDFIGRIEHPRKKQDALQLLQIFEEVTGFEASMWGPSIIGFGSYHYKYASGHEGDAPLAAFSPRQAKITLYLMYDSDERNRLLENFGTHTKSKACIYINKLADIDTEVLKTLIRRTLEDEKVREPKAVEGEKV